jgi:hypothetical protein
MLSHATNNVGILVVPGILLVKCCYDELGMIDEYLSLCRIVDSSNLTFHVIMIFLYLGTQQ